MITVLLSSYNGERFIAEQIDSILSQTIPVRLIVSDDGSDDGTWDTLEKYAQNYPNRIEIIRNSGRRGAAYNFIHLSMTYKDDYLMFADQDDVWMKDKAERTLAFMREQESKYGKGTPVMVYTDMKVVSENLNVISDSYMKMMNADFGRNKLHQVMAQNTAAGCTCMYNRALAGLINEEPSFMVMHDWWLALIAVCFGHIAALEEPTILYRQHQRNFMGAKAVTTLSYKLDRFLHGGNDIRKAVGETYTQAKSFLSVFGGGLTPEQISLLEDYAAMPEYGKLKRARELIRLKAWKNGVSRRIAQLWYI